MKQKLDILVLSDLSTDPGDQDFRDDLRSEAWRMEREVLRTLKKLGHTTRLICIYNDIRPLLDAIEAQRPDLIFNLAEQFNDQPMLERNIPALLELLGIPFTGSGPVGLTLCKNKAITNHILSAHRIRMPRSVMFHPDQAVRLPKRLCFPLFVKPLRVEASVGISKSSFVETEADLAERVRFIHDKFAQPALVEEFIDGRELYVSVLGNTRLTVLPIRELKFGTMPPDEPRFATYKMKWDSEYRKKWNIRNTVVTNFTDGHEAKIQRLCKKAFRLLQLRGYARFDLRLRDDGTIYLLEANPNPFIAEGEDLPASAENAGISYCQLIEKIAHLALTKKS